MSNFSTPGTCTRAFLHACLGVRAASSVRARARVRSVVKNHRKLRMPVSFPSTSIAAATAAAATTTMTTTTTTTTTTSTTPPFLPSSRIQSATYCAPPRLSRTVPDYEIRINVDLTFIQKKEACLGALGMSRCCSTFLASYCPWTRSQVQDKDNKKQETLHTSKT
ncbi:uncharacterized protein LOC105427367 [Pogonomyrmex barbatus]|uniref:Uncharacterized protein LOC105427367 n=1 Tax=Pogonomyrmex barbatus TaxID=144034 RepID=A0A6I9WZ95_9HYME|nr:uncharacterized protein LOC105427367 [Pogonomyrmex barbatus]